MSYYYIFSLLAFNSAVGVYAKKELKFFLFLISVFVLVIFAGWRGENTFPDYWNYVYTFEAVPDISEWLIGRYRYSFAEVWMEPGYVIVGAIVKFFTDNYIWMFTTIAFFSVGLASYNYQKYAYLTNANLVLLLFFVHTYFFRDMTQIRAACAAAIGLFLIKTIDDKRYVISFVITLLAGMFHMASLILLLIIPFSFLKLNKKRIMLFVVLSVVLGGSGLSYWLVNNLPAMGYITQKLINYSTSNYAERIPLLDITNVKNVSILFFILLFLDDIYKKIPYSATLVSFFVMGVCWRILMGDFGIFAGRAATFFNIVEVILVAGLPMLFKRKLLPTIIVIMYAFLVLYLNVELKLEPYYISDKVFSY